MAITKWIPAFGAANPTATPSAPPPKEIVPVITTAEAKQFGLENFGNTCYANSVLQALYFCGPFRELLVQYPDPFADALPPPTTFDPPPPTQPPPSAARPKPKRKDSITEVLGFPVPVPVSSSTAPPPALPTLPSIPIPHAPKTLLSALRSLYLHISRNPADKGTVAPRAFIDKLKELNELFRSTMHQDAHEFLNYLLNQIVEEMDKDRKDHQIGNGSPNGTPGEDLSASIGTLSSAGMPTFLTKNTLVHQLFEGVLTSETRCLTCETVSSRDESFLDLSIDIEQNSSVTACLRQFSASEMLCQRNKFFCDSCCDLQEAEKRMKIKKLPNVLALHLKRFKYQEDVGKYIKLAYRVAFPLELRLFNTVDDAQNPDRLYELFAIVVHIGNGPHHGHYVSVVKARGTWFLFDDDTVETVKESDIPKYFGDSNAGSAYVLYYQAVDLDKSALGLREPEPVASVVPIDSSASQSTTLATTFESDETTVSSPALPPGLTPQTSEDTEASGSSSQHPPSSFPSSSSPQPIPHSQPPLSLSIPPASSSVDNATSSPTVPSTPGGSDRKRFFNSLRHSPSIGLRMRPSSSHGNSVQRNSVVEPPPPVPSIPIPSTSHPVNSENPAPITSPSPKSAPSSLAPSPLTAINSNGKEKEKSSSTWWKRKSKHEKPPAEHRTSVLDDGATPWYKSNKHINRQASEAGLASSSMPTTPVSSATATPPDTSTVPERTEASAERAEKKISRQRPSTAGASLDRPMSTLFSPIPAMPTSPPPARPSTAHHDSVSPLNGSAHPPPQPARTSHRPHTAHASVSPPSLGYAPSSNGTTSTLAESASSSSGGTTSKAKRATRKLSLTAPMLGFGRRDKEKRPHTPTAVSSQR